jgi:hypothetical protein
VIIDGTFWSVPNAFTQLITISGCFFGKKFALVYCLLSSKQESLYKQVFNKLTELIDFNIKNIIIDFESGLKNALNFCFPNSKIYGCSFHYSQAVWRKLQSLGLTSQYNNDKEFKKTIKNILNLIYLFLEKVNETFLYIKNKGLEKFPVLKEFFLF